MTPTEPTPSEFKAGRQGRRLTAREREIVGLLAGGMSGAEIASKLFLSPETVRTHIRNAMAKLGASTRSQAVVLALQQDELGERERGEEIWQDRPALSPAPTVPGPSPKLDRALQQLLTRLCALHEIDSGLVFLADEDGMSLRRVAVGGDDATIVSEVPERVALGEGPLGKVALNRRIMLVSGLAPGHAASGTAVAAPILASGDLLGVLGLTVRGSRPTAQGELMLLQALTNRVGEILRGGGDIDRHLDTIAERFSASWHAATH